MRITIGEYTLRKATGEHLFLSSIAESADGHLQVQFFCTKRENAVTMIESQAHDLCARLRSMEIQCFVTLAFNPYEDANA